MKCILRICPVLLLLNPVLASVVEAQDQEWSTTVNLTDPTAISSSPDVALSSDGTMALAVWNNLLGTILQSSAAVVNGGVASWGTTIDGTAIDFGVSPRVALSADGTTAAAIWALNDGSNAIIKSASATVSGGTISWGTTTNLSSPGQDSLAPQIVLSSDGTRATAIWTRSDGANYIVQSASATVTGNVSSWSTPTDLSLTGGNSLSPHIALSADGTKASAAWAREFVVQSACASISGNSASWGGITDLSTGGEGHRAQVAISSDGTKVSAVWGVRNLGSLEYFVQSASATVSGNSASWGATSNVTGTSVVNPIPQIGISSDGTSATAVWLFSDGSNDRLQSSSATISGSTATWGSFSYLSPAGLSAVNPSVKVSSDGSKASAIWLQNDGSNYTAHSASGSISGTTSTWNAVSALGPGDPSFSLINQPRLALSPNGTVALVLWHHVDLTGGLKITVKSASALITYPTPTPTSAPTPTVTPTPEVTPTPTMTPRGKASRAAPVPRIRNRHGRIRISIKDTVQGYRNYFIVVIDTSTELVLVRKRLKIVHGAGRSTLRNLDTGTYRVYSLVTRSHRRTIHSEGSSLQVS